MNTYALLIKWKAYQVSVCFCLNFRVGILSDFNRDMHVHNVHTYIHVGVEKDKKQPLPSMSWPGTARCWALELLCTGLALTARS